MIELCLIDIQKCSEYFDTFSFSKKLKNEEREREYIVFRPNGVLLCYSKRVVNVPTFPTSISFYKSRCKTGKKFFELDPKHFESMPTMKEFRNLIEMGDSCIKGRQRISQRTEIPIGYRVF